MITQNLITIGQRIRWLREKKKMNQTTLARAVGITPPSMSEIELGKTKAPAAATLFKIAAILEANPEWLLHGRGDYALKRSPPTDAGTIEEMSSIMAELTPEQQATLLAVARALKP